MAATLTLVRGSEDVLGTRHRTYSYDVALDSSYPSNGSSTFGYPVAANLVGVGSLSQVEFVEFQDTTVPPSGYVFAWDKTHGTIRVFQSGGFTPAGTVAAPTINTVNDSGTPTKALGELTGALSTNGAVTGLTGVQAPAFTGTPVAAGVLSEVANTTNLSAVTVRARFVTQP